MSWSINIVGKPADVKASVQANNHILPEIQSMVTAYAEIIGSDPDAAMQVESCGHFGRGESWSYLASLSIKRVELAKTPTPPTP